MSVESTLSQHDRWFLGEMKTLRYTVAGATAADPLELWQLRWELQPRRRGAPTVLTKTTEAGIVVVTPTVAQVAIFAPDTAGLQPGPVVLRLLRIDVPQILALHRAVLRDPAEAS